jgi:3-oxoacyl-[acyl-carrier protein] reductase
MTFDAWRAAQAVCVDGAFHCAQSALPALRVRGGSIVNIGGMTASTGAAHRAHVVTAKAAIAGSLAALAHELAEFGITVNCVSPASSTPCATRPARARTRAPRKARDTRGPARYVEEIASAVVWLASPGGRFMTGRPCT